MGNYFQRQAMAVPADLNDPYLKKWVKPTTNPFLVQVGAAASRRPRAGLPPISMRMYDCMHARTLQQTPFTRAADAGHNFRGQLLLVQLHLSDLLCCCCCTIVCNTPQVVPPCMHPCTLTGLQCAWMVLCLLILTKASCSQV
jgi:hypothetical protein